MNNRLEVSVQLEGMDPDGERLKNRKKRSTCELGPA